MRHLLTEKISRDAVAGLYIEHVAFGTPVRVLAQRTSVTPVRLQQLFTKLARQIMYSRTYGCRSDLVLRWISGMI